MFLRKRSQTIMNDNEPNNESTVKKLQTPTSPELSASSLALLKSLPEVKQKIHNVINIKNSFGETAIHLACMDKSDDLLDMLIKLGADVNVKTSLGSYILHIVCETGDLKKFTDLIKAGADLSAKNHIGESPLHFVTRYKRVKYFFYFNKKKKFN